MTISNTCSSYEKLSFLVMRISVYYYRTIVQICQQNLQTIKRLRQDCLKLSLLPRIQRPAGSRSCYQKLIWNQRYVSVLFRYIYVVYSQTTGLLWPTSLVAISSLLQVIRGDIRHIHANWKSTLLGMKRRDEALADTLLCLRYVAKLQCICMSTVSVQINYSYVDRRSGMYVALLLYLYD